MECEIRQMIRRLSPRDSTEKERMFLRAPEGLTAINKSGRARHQIICCMDDLEQENGLQCCEKEDYEQVS